MSNAYINSEQGLWTVGHYEPGGRWIAESDHSTEIEAVNRVHFLNGGSPAAAAPTGEPAFPCPTPHSDQGMSLRDYFAAQAMLIVGDSVRKHASTTENGSLDYEACANLSRDAYQIADAMLAARQKGGAQ